MDPSHGPTAETLLQEAHRCRQAGAWPQAEQLYRQVLAIAPDNVHALQELASLAAQFGQYRLAVEFLERALVVQPGLESAAAGLAHMRRELALSVDPDYAEPPQASWAADACLLEETHGSRTALVLFAGLGVARSPPTFVFRKFLAPYHQVDKLFVRDLSLSWYLRGIPGVAADVDATVEVLAERLRGYQRTVFLGTSAGATAAILYGALLGANKVIAFAPQALLSDRKPAELGDTRWEQRLAVLRRDLAGSRYLDLTNLNPFRIPIDIYYHGGAGFDGAHASLLNGPAVRLHPQPGAGHLIALQMRDNGLLRPVIERELPV